jgi:hypothetical protein
MRFSAASASRSPAATLFRYLRQPDAAGLFSALGERGIFLRHFSDRPHVLRVGLPGPDEEWQRLESALADCLAAQRSSKGNKAMIQSVRWQKSRRWSRRPAPAAAFLLAAGTEVVRPASIARENHLHLIIR